MPNRRQMRYDHGHKDSRYGVASIQDSKTQWSDGRPARPFLEVKIMKRRSERCPRVIHTEALQREECARPTTTDTT